MKAPTLRQLSERIRDHLTRQHEVSLEPAPVTSHNPGCAYRGANGKMCAVGILISDEHYFSEFEGNTIFDSDEIPDAIGKSLGITLSFKAAEMLAQWQTYHDSPSHYRAWVAAAHGGTISPGMWHDVCMRDFNGDESAAAR